MVGLSNNLNVLSQQERNEMSTNECIVNIHFYTVVSIMIFF